ncbi:MAG: Jag N-terminal domain-containing protein, partial [Oscillospiraceae bacterium]|nr:Jag N-terminal domain-containing protein [Oscillospiraceae bacterium]
MTGKTVEEAVEAACAALGVLRDECSVQVIELPQKRLFGSVPAKVRVYISDDAFSVKDLLRSQDEQPELKTSVEADADAKEENKAKAVKKEQKEPVKKKPVDKPDDKP